MPITDDQIKKFSTLFSGYDNAYGEYEIDNILGKPGEKLVAPPNKRKTISGPIPTSRWRDHLEGRGRGLGVLPLRSNDTCLFGAIDCDNRMVNHDELVRTVQKLELPLVVCRSKSGGAHLYVFFKEEVPATIVRERLAEWTAALGFSDSTELFPKQTARASKDDIGNWINIPYYDSEKTFRYCVHNSKNLSLDEFLETAEAFKIDTRCASKPYFKQQSNQDLFWEGPPCLIALHSKGGFAEGTRNDGMFAVGVYLRKRYGDEWSNHMDEYNEVMAKLPSSEIVGIVKSLRNKEKKTEGYTYPCKRGPYKHCLQ
jgi:hypothetical protein